MVSLLLDDCPDDLGAVPPIPVAQIVAVVHLVEWRVHRRMWRRWMPEVVDCRFQTPDRAAQRVHRNAERIVLAAPTGEPFIESANALECLPPDHPAATA